MSWRTIYISSRQKMSLRNNNLIIKDFENKEKERSFSLDDIGTIMIDNYKSIITIATLIEISEKNINLIICNKSHDPIGNLLPFSHHHMPAKNFNLQLQIKEEIRLNLQRQIISSKINNQALVVSYLGIEEEHVEKLKKWAKEVRLKDLSNREGIAAKYFFRQLYGSNFVRDMDIPINRALNYGYKILASCISRTLIKYGLNPIVGLFHKTKTNYYNLSYDFIEPYRPLVDLIVSSKLGSLDENLTINDRIKLVEVLETYCFINNNVMKVKDSIDYMIRSFISVLNHPDKTLHLPTIYKDISKRDLHENNED